MTSLADASLPTAASAALAIIPPTAGARYSDQRDRRPRPIPSEVPWDTISNYSKHTARLSVLIRQWANDAATIGIRGGVNLRRDLRLPNWPRATSQLSIYQCLDLVALLDAFDGDDSALDWFE